MSNNIQVHHILQTEIPAASYFRKLKNQLRGIRFNDDNEMLPAFEQAIDSLTKEDFKNCFNDWFIRMHKCIDAEGQYFEKIHYNRPLNTYPKSFCSAPRSILEYVKEF